MYVKVKFERVGELIKISEFSGMAPCQILRLNKATKEDELIGKEILVNVNIVALQREVGWYWKLDNGKILKQVAQTH